MSVGRELWHTDAAASWFAALPVGNGRLGAMTYGRIGKQTIQLNEDSVVWTGPPAPRDDALPCEHLDEVRRLLLEGRVQEAQFLAGGARSSAFLRRRAPPAAT